MPHLTILYTPAVAEKVALSTLCRDLADAMLAQRDEAGKQVFPTGGTRVLATPAAYSAVADGKGDYDFVYLNLRMGAGRSTAVHQAVGAALSAVIERHFAPLIARQLIGVTLQIDESAPVFDAKFSSLHRHFQGQGK